MYSLVYRFIICSVNITGRVVVKVDGLAASIASLIAMAGGEIVMLPGAMMMVHKTRGQSRRGSADELGRAVEMLEKTCENYDSSLCKPNRTT